MAVGLYMDVHVPQAITDQLRTRAVDVLTAWDDGCNELPDEQLLEHAREISRLTFTQDIRFKALAEHWQRATRDFAGLVFAHQLSATIGQLVKDLELIAKASEPEEWMGRIEHLPWR